MKLQDAIQIIEDAIINGRFSELKFTIADDWNENNNLPVVDIQIIGNEGVEIFGDLNFESFTEAIITTAKGLNEL